MLRLTVILALVLSCHGAYAEAESGRFEVSEIGDVYWLPDWLSTNIFYDFKKQLIEMKSQVQAQQQVGAQENVQCQSAYQNLFKKTDVRWSIFFGYGDGDGKSYTSDFAERDLLEKEVRMPCPERSPEIQFCGFSQKSQPGEYVRQIRTKENAVVNIHLRLFNASLTSMIKDNMHGKRQIRKSRALEKQYIEALQTDDIVFYAGHARHGSGPGFRPLVRKSKDWWIATLFRPMMNNVLYALNPNRHNNDEGIPAFTKTVANPSIIGMFSCEAEAHFGSSFANNSESGLILTRQSVSNADNMRLLYAASNALMAQECEDEFHASMKESITKIYYRKDKRPPSNYEKKMPRVFNFFHKDKIKYKNDLLLYFQNRDEVEMDIITKEITP